MALLLQQLLLLLLLLVTLRSTMAEARWLSEPAALPPERRLVVEAVFQLLLLLFVAGAPIFMMEASVPCIGGDGGFGEGCCATSAQILEAAPQNSFCWGGEDEEGDCSALDGDEQRAQLAAELAQKGGECEELGEESLEETGEELLTGTRSLGLEEPTGTHGASPGLEAVRGHFVRPGESPTRTSSHPFLTLNVAGQSGQAHRSGEVLRRAAFAAEDDLDATDGEESGEDVPVA